MISFEIIDNSCLQKVDNSDAREILEEIISSFDEDSEIGAVISHGCLLVRIFDFGRYYFLYPFALLADASVARAVDELVLYATREELPLVISDVPKEELGELIVGFTHLDIDAQAPDCESYVVRVKTECQMAERIPEHHGACVSLTPLTPSDTAPLARLSRDREINRFWGYDFREDYGTVADGHFLEEAECEFRRGVAMTFAVRHAEEFVGDAVLYAFDGRGNAHLGVRILPEHHRRGYATAAILALFDIGRKLGLSRIFAECHKENLASKNMLATLFSYEGEDGEKLLFKKDIL